MVIGTSFSWVGNRACEGEGSSDEREQDLGGIRRVYMEYNVEGLRLDFSEQLLDVAS